MPRTKMANNVASCTCDRCVSACYQAPGWFGLDDAEVAIDAGYAKKMMLDWWEEHDDGDNNTYVLAPAVVGFGGRLAPDIPEFPFSFGWVKGRCSLLDDKSRCTIHSTGFKPAQCRALGHGVSLKNQDAIKPWRTKRGLALIRRWKKEVKYRG